MHLGSACLIGWAVATIALAGMLEARAPYGLRQPTSQKKAKGAVACEPCQPAARPQLVVNPFSITSTALHPKRSARIAKSPANHRQPSKATQRSSLHAISRAFPPGNGLSTPTWSSFDFSNSPLLPFSPLPVRPPPFASTPHCKPAPLVASQICTKACPATIPPVTDTPYPRTPFVNAPRPFFVHPTSTTPPVPTTRCRHAAPSPLRRAAATPSSCPLHIGVLFIDAVLVIFVNLAPCLMDMRPT